MMTAPQVQARHGYTSPPGCLSSWQRDRSASSGDASDADRRTTSLPVRMALETLEPALLLEGLHLSKEASRHTIVGLAAEGDRV